MSPELLSVFRFYLNFVTEEIIKPHRYLNFGFDFFFLLNCFTFLCDISPLQNNTSGTNLLHGDGDGVLRPGQRGLLHHDEPRGAAAVRGRGRGQWRAAPDLNAGRSFRFNLFISPADVCQPRPAGLGVPGPHLGGPVLPWSAQRGLLRITQVRELSGDGASR